MPKPVTLYDCTLREGAQGTGASFTLEAKMRVARMLDALGVAYIEAGNPFSNPKDAELYRLCAQQPLPNATLVAFGSTSRVGANACDDAGVRALLDANTKAVCVFGKSWPLHVETVLKTTREENLRLIEDTLAYIRAQGREIIYDAEHFFDGYKADADYAMRTLDAAMRGGARYLTLCDTNGGCFPHEIEAITADMVQRFGDGIGIHCHNDTGMAAANTLYAVRAGATLAQVTTGGWGERCGNADLCTVLPDLQLKLGYACVPADRMASLTPLARTMCELANVRPNERAPFVGVSAFTHKAGMHIDAVLKNPCSFEHIAPEAVGSERRFALSEVAGRNAILERARRIDATLTKDSPHTASILDRLKALEFEGYQFEGADASFELLVRRELSMYEPFFSLTGFKVIVVEPSADGEIATAMIDVTVDGEREVTAATGNGPVNALDLAARKALERFYPSLHGMTLRDYQVRVLDSTHHTAAKVRVLIESGDGEGTWTTVGVSSDIIDASWKALVDSIEYKLLRDARRGEGA